MSRKLRPLRLQNSEYPRMFQVTRANQNVQKLLSTDLVNTKKQYCNVLAVLSAYVSKETTTDWTKFLSFLRSFTRSRVTLPTPPKGENHRMFSAKVHLAFCSYKLSWKICLQRLILFLCCSQSYFQASNQVILFLFISVFLFLSGEKVYTVCWTLRRLTPVSGCHENVHLQ